jgi:hypothetical protein
MLVDKKLLSAGIVMLIVGAVIMIYLNMILPLGHTGMTEEEIIDLMTRQQEIQDKNMLAGILIGIGFLLILISFGAHRRNGSPKKEEKKPIT